jgi:hypothetical protein
MHVRKEFQERLASEYGYAVTKMQETPIPARKLFYFSVLFGEAQRILNLEWDRDLALVFSVAQYTHTQFTAATQIPGLAQIPLDWAIIYEKLTQVTSDIAAYYEKTENDNREEIYQILGRLAEVAYAISGNGSYLYEKGHIKL